MNPSLRANDAFEYELLTGWIEASGVGLCAFDSDGFVVALNRLACTFLQVDPAEAVNLAVDKIMVNAVNAADAVLWVQSTDVDNEFVLRSNIEGRNQFLLLKRQWVLAGKGELYQVLSFSDISDLLAAREQLNRQAVQETKRREWQALNAGLVISDALQADMPMVYVNSAFERMSGYSSAELVGRNCRLLQGGDTQQPGLQSIRSAIANQTSGYAVLRNYRKDGSGFVNELFISPIRDSTGRVIQYIGVQHLRSDDFL